MQLLQLVMPALPVPQIQNMIILTISWECGGTWVFEIVLYMYFMWCIVWISLFISLTPWVITAVPYPCLLVQWCPLPWCPTQIADGIRSLCFSACLPRWWQGLPGWPMHWQWLVQLTWGGGGSIRRIRSSPSLGAPCMGGAPAGSMDPVQLA